jgi:hypothetical protein
MLKPTENPSRMVNVYTYQDKVNFSINYIRMGVGREDLIWKGILFLL